MKTMLKVTAAGLALLFAMSGVAGAGTQLRTRDQLRDGSCQVAASQYRYRERARMRDGSRLGGDQLREQLRDRLRDGSCRLA